MKEEKLTYVSPQIVVINLELEQCIAASVAPNQNYITETWENTDDTQSKDIEW
jgi:hypothetical protein